ncbi:unnamed protein product [Rotaria sp. Silwood1]|nr:unnamed protein product [Rotaria sp. Silwood1]CAF3380161.1 unnamed protein product [Rotaria sp. Silwood1]CAF3386131.1 unnamed protein product [Rotaria sp. Silwood1]CAF4596707.1 unnamed protein product [Rotaria sp. Silwood1]
MLDDNHLFQRAASSAYASMAAFTAAANMYNSFYPTATNTNMDPVNYFGCTDMKRERLDPKVRVKLEDMDLWKRFYSLGNEMIITKSGRRLFPNFRVSVSELDPNAKYMFLLDIVPMDDNRYKYHESSWTISGKAEPHLYGRYYVHPDSPQTGSQWMKQSILFNKVKITNSPMQNPNHIILNSMHRYIPRLHIVEASDSYSMRTGPLSTFIFDETVFIAVTAYQNDQITKLKINNNPFAKGFREPTPGKKSNTKPLKRLQSSLPVDKSVKYDENLHRPYKSDSSLLSINSNSPPTQSTMHAAAADSTTSTYLDNSVGDHEQDSDINSMNFTTSYPHHHHHHQFSSNSFYSNYVSDPSSMIYNPAYTYMGTTSNPIPSTSTPMHFNPYGRYPTSVYQTNNYNTSFF